MNSMLSILLISLIQLFSSPEDIELVFAGDAMQHGPQIQTALQSDGSYDYTKCFELVKDEISSADFAVVNLECPLGGKPYAGYPAFSAPDDFAQALKDAGFDMFLTANNHSLDRRDKGAIRTLHVLDSLEIPHIGTYINESDRNRKMPYIVDIKGYAIAFLGYTYGTNGIPVQKDFVVNHINREKMVKDIRDARNLGADMVCVMLHWGVEYSLKPNKSQKELADFLISEGVDMIIGGHPHVVQPFEMRFNPKTGKNALIVYSLGNFISNQNDTNSRGGAMIRVKIGALGMSVVIKEATYSLVFVQKPSYDARYYQLVPAHRVNLIKPHSMVQFNSFVKNAGDLFEKYNVGVKECNWKVDK